MSLQVQGGWEAGVKVPRTGHDGGGGLRPGARGPGGSGPACAGGPCSDPPPPPTSWGVDAGDAGQQVPSLRPTSAEAPHPAGSPRGAAPASRTPGSLPERAGSRSAAGVSPDPPPASTPCHGTFRKTGGSRPPWLQHPRPRHETSSLRPPSPQYLVQAPRAGAGHARWAALKGRGQRARAVKVKKALKYLEVSYCPVSAC